MQPVVSTILVEVFLENSIRQMGAVPGQQVVNPVQDRQAKVRGISGRFGGKLKKTDQFRFQPLKLFRHIELGQGVEVGQAPRRCRWVPARRLSPDECRTVKQESMPVQIPPLMRHRLMSGHRLLAAGIGGQIAWNRGFDVNRLHVPKVA